MSEGFHPPVNGGRYRFGPFEVDAAAGELRRDGSRRKLQDQPFQILLVLLENAGDVVSREEIQKRVWSDGTFVDFDNSLNAAINKIRHALRDSATAPRFVETVAKRGYRFIAPLEDSVQTAEGSQGRAYAWPFDRPLAPPVLLIAALAVAGAALVASIYHAPRPTPAAPLLKFSYAPEGGFRHPVISPDGSKIAYVGGQDSLWIQELAKTSPQRIPGTEGAREPFWSPGSDFVAFASGAHLKKVSLHNGVVATLCELPTRDFRGGTWSPDGKTILFDVLDYPDNLHLISADGGKPEPMRFTADNEHRPQFLPGRDAGKAFLFGVEREVISARWIAAYDWSTRQIRRLANGRFPVFAGPSHVIFEKRTEGTPTLWAIPFSASTLKPAGDAFAIASNASRASVSRNGILVYREGSQAGKSQLVWRDRTGKRLGPIGEPQEEIRYPSLSPDERRVAARGLESGNYDIWLHDVDRPRKERFTSGPDGEHLPVWSPDGKLIAFTVRRKPKDLSQTDILIKPLDRSFEETPVLATPEREMTSGWSRDGTKLLYYQFPKARENARLGYLERVENTSDFRDVPGALFPGCCAKFSPDGRFLAHLSMRSGRIEVWMSSFPDGARARELSHLGGRQPRWSRDGTEIFYVEGNALVSVKVKTGSEFTAGGKEVLFRSDSFSGSYIPQYDVTADGQRFVVAEPLAADAPARIRVVQNWYEEFRDRAVEE